jgi:hypothetical protein
MGTATFMGTTNVTGALVDTVSTPTYTMQGGGTTSHALINLVARSGAVLDTPVQAVTYAGSEAFNFVGQQVSGGTNVVVEIWALPAPVAESGVIKTDFTPTDSVSVISIVVEIMLVGIDGPVLNVFGDAGGTSPLTVTVSSSDGGGHRYFGEAPTIVVPAGDNLLVGMGCMYKAGTASTISISNGTQIGTGVLVAGTGGSTITAGAAWLQASSTTISWTESLDREWAEAVAEIPGCTLGDVIRSAAKLHCTPF